jgi:hypothetical protein
VFASLFDPQRGAQTLKELVAATAVSLDWHWRIRERQGMAEPDIIRDLGLSLPACKALNEFTSRAMNGARGPDHDGDLPMWDGTDGRLPNGQVINANLVDPSAVVWGSIQRFWLGE